MGYSFDFVAGNLSVTQAPLTITANDASKVYGAALPTFSASFSGLLNGDSSSVVSGLQFSSSGSAQSGVGQFSVTPGGALAGNYSISYVGGTLTVTPAPLTIAAVNQARLLNVPNSALAVDFIGLVNADVPGDVLSVTLSTTAQTRSPAGDYPIIVSGGVNGNYDITRVDGTLTVAPLPTEAIQGEWQTVQQSAPNFGVVQTSILPTAQTGEQAPARGLPGNLVMEANVPGRVRGRGNIALSREQMMQNAIMHVSSFDVGVAR